jgi:hypothetical protein
MLILKVAFLLVLIISIENKFKIKILVILDSYLGEPYL